MPCIVGLEHNNKIYIGSDSTSHDSNVKTRFYRTFKTEQYIVGYTAPIKVGYLLQHRMEYIHDAYNSPLYHIITDVLPIINAVKEEHNATGEFLIGYKTKLYSITKDMQINSGLYGFNACGDGASYALGALWALQSIPDMSPQRKLLRAIDAASEFFNNVSGPYNIVEL